MDFSVQSESFRAPPESEEEVQEDERKDDGAVRCDDVQ
jgi:hypothetical protein